MGDPRTRRDSPKFAWTLQGDGQAQETSVGPKFLDPYRVQAKEGSALAPLFGCQNCQLEKKKAQGESCEFSFIWGPTEDYSWEIPSGLVMLQMESQNSDKL